MPTNGLLFAGHYWSVFPKRFPEVEATWVQDVTQTITHLEEAYAIGTRELPKLILLDLYLPDRQYGYSLLQTIKAHHLFREIPIVMLSQSTDPDDISESYNLRTNSYIVKPSGYEKWLDCIASFRHYWWDAVTLPKFA